MVGKPSIEPAPDSRSSRERPGTPTRRRWLTVVGAAGLLAACSSAALASSEEADGLAARSAPPTKAEARAWDEAFLSREGDADAKARALAAPRPAARGKRSLFPQNRMVSLYGAAGGFGVLGRKSVSGAARKLKKQVRPYRKRGDEPVIKAFDLVAVIATQCSGPNDKCRIRVSDATIRRYLSKIRNLNGRLILDVQPARANALDELDRLRKWLRKPDVDLAVDAEWNVGPRGKPGVTQGAISAKKINRMSKRLMGIVKNRGLPQKALIVHHFHQGSIKNKRNIRRRDKVDVTLNFDGIGSPSAKKAGYRALRSRRLFNGFSLFYKLDRNLMSPSSVLKLNPEPYYVMYQ
jgi:hypothetical protein